MGGSWGYMLAYSEEQIQERFPELVVVHERPAGLTPEGETKIRERMTFDIDDTSHPFMAALLADRSKHSDGRSDDPKLS